MASYEDSSAINDMIQTAVADGAFSAETAAAIDALVKELGDNAASATQSVTTDLTSADQIAADTQLIVMSADSSADVTFGADSEVKAMVVGGGGESNVVFETSDDVTVQLSGGENDTVATGAGDDTISFNGGSATIDTGDGNDTVVLGGSGTAVVNSQGGGINVFQILQDFIGEASITGGEGFDRVAFLGGRHGHSFGFANGKFTMHSDAALTMENVNIISFDTDGNPDTVEQITVLAETEGEALVAKLYQVALGREGIDDSNGWLAPGLDGSIEANHQLGGINWWITQGGADEVNANLNELGKRFLDCDEFHNLYDNMSDADYVAALYNNLSGSAAADTAQYVEALANGGMDRYTVAIQIAQSQEASLILGNDGDQYVITPA